MTELMSLDNLCSLKIKASGMRVRDTVAIDNSPTVDVILINAGVEYPLRALDTWLGEDDRRVDARDVWPVIGHTLVQLHVHRNGEVKGIKWKDPRDFSYHQIRQPGYGWGSE
jgi:hypothetical protein